MAFAITPQGFVIKTLDIINSEIDSSIKAALGDFINTLPEDVFGQLKGIFAEREASLWEAMQFVFDSQYPLSAQDVSLDLVAQINGILRKNSTKSKVAGQILIGTDTTVIAAGTVMSVDGDPTSRFVMDDAVVLGPGSDEVQDVTFSIPPTTGTWSLELDGVETSQLQFDDDATAVEAALNALSNTFGGISVTGDYTVGFTVTFADADGKQPISLMVALTAGLDAIIGVAETTPGVVQGTVNMTAEAAGSSFKANARTLTVIETPVSGFDSTFNPVDATIGDDVETDAELRIRRDNSLGTNAAGTLPAIRTALLELDEIEAAFVIENDQDIVVSGRPPKSFEAVVEQAGGATDDDVDTLVAESIFDTKPAGIQAFGNDVTKIVVDSQGFDHTIEFSRPIAVDIYLEVDISSNNNFPPNGQTLVEQALLAFGTGLNIGEDVIIRPDLIGSLDDIPGITDVVVRIGIAPGPTLDNNIPIEDGTSGTIEKSAWDSANIIVLLL